MMSTKTDDYLAEMEKIVAYLLTFSLEAYKCIDDEDQDGLLDLIMERADDIFLYKDGKELPTTPLAKKNSVKNGWKVI